MTFTTKLTARAETKFAGLIDAVDDAQSRVLTAQKRIKSRCVMYFISSPRVKVMRRRCAFMRLLAAAV